MRKFRGIAAAFLLSSALIARADTLEKTSGQRLDGRVIAETTDTVTFEVVSGGITFTQKVPRAQIKSLQREIRLGPGYCAIPLIGEVGIEITAKEFKAALAE